MQRTNHEESQEFLSSFLLPPESCKIVQVIQVHYEKKFPRPIDKGGNLQLSMSYLP